MLEGFAVRAACVPFPASEMTSGEFVAVESIVMLPETLPLAVGANPTVKDAVDPAAMVCPALIPVALKPAPAAVTLLIVSVAFPKFVSVIVSVLLLPTTTLLKLKLPGFAPRVLPAATALPVIVKTWLPPAALSAKRTLPLAPTVDVGANCMLSVVDWFGAIVAGRERPLIPKPVPETVAAVITRFVFPLFVSVTFCVLVCPTITLLKFSEAGENETPASTPVPLSAILKGESDALLAIVRAPAAAFMDVGANWSCTVALCPAANELDGLPPTTVKTPPEMFALDIVTAAVPVFVTLTLCVAVFPTATLPKLMLEADAVSVPVLVVSLAPALFSPLLLLVEPPA